MMRIAALVLLALVPVGARAQTIADVPTPAAGQAKTDWVLEHLEAPQEIALGTIALNVWARIAPRGAAASLVSATLLLEESGGEVRVPMKRISDDPVEFVAAVDTYAWVEDAAHPYAIRIRAEDGESTVGRGAIRVKPRIDAADLVVMDARGLAHSWIGSGAGGFTPVGQLDAGRAGGRAFARDRDGDGFLDLLVPTEAGVLQFLRNKGNGTLEIAASHRFGRVVDTAVGDVDGDGKPDLVTVSAGMTLEVRPGIDEGPPLVLDLGLAPERVTTVDIDGDGAEEIVVGLLGFAETEVEVWGLLAGEKGSWVPRERLSAPEGGRGRLVALEGIAGEGDRPGRILILTTKDGEGTLESRERSADTESGTDFRALRLPGEPIGVVPGRFASGKDGLASLVLVAEGKGVAFLEIREGEILRRGFAEGTPDVFAAVDLDGDGDDDLVTGGEDLRLWINVQGGEFREAGESPYLLDAPAVALASGGLDERRKPESVGTRPRATKE